MSAQDDPGLEPEKGSVVKVFFGIDTVKEILIMIYCGVAAMVMIYYATKAWDMINEEFEIGMIGKSVTIFFLTWLVVVSPVLLPMLIFIVVFGVIVHIVDVKFDISRQWRHVDKSMRR